MQWKRSYHRWVIGALAATIMVTLFVDVWPQTFLPLELRELTKITNVIFLPWSFKASSLPQYHLTFKTSKTPLLAVEDLQSKDLKVEFITDNHTYAATIIPKNHYWLLDFSPEVFQGYGELEVSQLPAEAVLAEAISQHRAQKLGLVKRDIWFTQVTLNDQVPQIYQFLEPWNKDVLEKNRRSSDSDVYAQTEFNLAKITAPTSWEKVAVNVATPSNYAPIQKFTELLSAPDIDFTTQAPHLIDLDSFTRWYAHFLLIPQKYRSTHQPLILYFNRESGQFEFLPLRVTPAPNPDNPFINTLITKMNTLEGVQERSQDLLEQYRGDPSAMQNDMNTYRQLVQAITPAFFADTTKPYSNTFAWLRLKEYKNILQKQFIPSQ